MAKRILIAEPNEYLTETITGVLSDLGFEVVATTQNESEVLSLAQEFEPDLLIVDLGMSKWNGDGQTGIKTIKEYLPNIKILVFGFHDAVHEVVESIEQAGFDGFCSKFDSSNGLLKSIEALIA